MTTKPSTRPQRPFFSSGPCAKRPGWRISALEDALVGRSHRAGPAKARLNEVIERSRKILGIPDDYRLGIVPASDTGAIELAMWNLLGPRPVTAMGWESFGRSWVSEISKELELSNVDKRVADYGALPSFDDIDPQSDVVFTWNGTTSGVRVPNGDWISPNREGLTLCDATSAVFAMDMPWDKLDVTTWSWQKALGGEAQHGMLALSPRAVERLTTTKAHFAIPKVFRVRKGDGIDEGVFVGSTINTPSMLAVEDVLDALRWCEEIGGFDALKARSAASLAAVEAWVDKTDWIQFLAPDPVSRSSTSICLAFANESAGSDDAARSRAKAMGKALDEEKVAYDINAYRDAPPGLRIWGGPTVDPEDVQAVLPWIDWAFSETA